MADRCPLCGSSAVAWREERDQDRLYRCGGCGVEFAWPQIEEKKLEAYYDETTDPSYLLKYRDESFRRAKVILGFFKKRGVKATLLDVGCGCGFFLKAAADAGWDAEGVEISPRAVELSKTLGNFRIRVGEFSGAAAGLGPVEAVSAQHILEHMREPRGFLALVREKLKPGGILAVAVPNAESWMRRWAGRDWVCLRERGHLFHFSPESLKNLLRQAGFRVLRWETPQWNGLDLLWAFRRRRMPKTPAQAEIAGATGEKGASFASAALRRAAGALAAPAARLAECRRRGAEILMFAEKI